MKRTFLVLVCTTGETKRMLGMQDMKRFGPILFLLAALTSSPNATQAQFTQQGNKLVGIDAVGAANQGISVSLSSDGNTAIVGGWYDNSQAGAAWVYKRTGGVWGQQGSKLVGTGAAGVARQGTSVSLSSDGNTAILSGYGDNSYAGAAWVFTRTGGVWSQQGSKLVGTGAAGVARQGTSVSLSSDGNTAIVGGFADNSYAGAVWVFTRTGGVWNQQGGKLVGTGAVGSAGQGTSVSLSSDGNTAIVGGWYDNSEAGAAWVYTRTGGVWSQQGSKLVGTGAVGNARQGLSVSLSSDGNTATVGGYGDNGFTGATWVYTRTGGVWSQQGSKLVGTGAVGTAQQGISVSLSSDGNTIVSGGFGDNMNAGAAWVFTRTGGVWSQQGSKLVGTGAVGAAYQGVSVSLSSDGNTAIVGGWYDNSQAGAAWAYMRDASSVPELGEEVPRRFGLQQNYPNPFNPVTTFQFSIVNRQLTILKVYEVLGGEVTTLVNEEKEPGTYTVQWDASGVTSGVYFYRLNTGRFVAVKKLIVLK
jgi:hypothetical protein